MQNHRIGPQTPRLTLRAMRAEDAEAFFALNSHPEVMRLTGEPPFTSVEQRIARGRDEVVDGLAGHRHVLGQVGGGVGALPDQAGDEASPGGVGQGGEDGVEGVPGHLQVTATRSRQQPSSR